MRFGFEPWLHGLYVYLVDIQFGRVYGIGKFNAYEGSDVKVEKRQTCIVLLYFSNTFNIVYDLYDRRLCIFIITFAIKIPLLLGLPL